MPDDLTPVDPMPIVPLDAPTPPQTPIVPSPGEDYQKRFTGLQQTLNGMLTRTGWQRLDAIPDQKTYERLQSEATAAADAARKFEEQQLAMQQTLSKLQEAESKLTATQLELTKRDLLAQKAPHLVGMAKYVPTSENLETEVDAFIRSMESVASGKQPPIAPPPANPPVGGQPKVDTSDLLRQMNEALASGDKAKYEQLRSDWRAANAAPSSRG